MAGLGNPCKVPMLSSGAHHVYSLCIPSCENSRWVQARVSTLPSYQETLLGGPLGGEVYSRPWEASLC